MKKIYIQPQLEVITIQIEAAILTLSGDSNSLSPLTQGVSFGNEF